MTLTCSLPLIFLRALQLLTLDLGLINKRTQLVVELVEGVMAGMWEVAVGLASGSSNRFSSGPCLGVSRRAV